LAGVQVTWRAGIDKPELEQVTKWIEARAQLQGATIAVETDVRGTARIAMGVPALATVRDSAGAPVKTVRVLPGEDVRITLPDTPITLRLVDDETLVPLAGEDLEFWFPREINAMSEVLRTSRDGIVTIFPSSFPILVRRPGSAVWQGTLVPHSPAMTPCGFGGEFRPLIRIEEPSDSEPMLIGFRPSGFRIQLIDQESGEPVDAPVRVERRNPAHCPSPGDPPFSDCTILSPRSPCGRPDEVYHSKRGILDLPCLVLGSEAESRGNDGIVLLAAGYRPCATTLASAADLTPGTSPKLTLQRAPSRTLRVVHRDGSPFLLAVGIYSPVENVMCWQSDGDSEGVHGPFDWFGGDMLVALGGLKDWSWMLRESDLASSEIAVITLPDDTGSIVIEGIPVGARTDLLIAKRGVGLAATEYRPRATASGECRFDSLPAGSYLVGPRGWVLGAELQSVSFDPHKNGEPHPTRVTVGPDQTAMVSWIDSWMAGRAIEGRVRVLSSEPIEPLLFPLYGPDGAHAEELPGDTPNMFFGRRSPRILIDMNGAYRIEPTDPLPKLIAVCAADDVAWGDVAGMHILEVLAPGESVEIRVGSIELQPTDSSPAQPLLVQYDVPLSSLRHPLFTYYAQYRMNWDGRSVLRLLGIPVQVTRLKVGNRSLPIELSERKPSIFSMPR
jgi:hypothetical protein